jgi:GNAT superfamily N-acetyltransferase
MSDEELIARVCETIQAYLALGCERFEACGATFIRSLTTPTRYDANTIGLIRDASQVDELLARADIEYAHLPFRNFHLDPLTPPQVEARLALAGYARWSNHLVMVLEGDLRAEVSPFDIREVVSESQWQDYYRLMVMNVIGDLERLGQPPPPQQEMEQLITYIRNKKGLHTWFAYSEGIACAFLSSWSGANGVGQVEDLFTHPDFRHRGMATALIAHGVAHARAGGAGPVVIIADPSDTPKEMYATMGFRPLFNDRSQYR